MPDRTPGNLPPAILASPADLPRPPRVPQSTDGVESTPFWRPSLTESLRFLGWRWVLILPALLILPVIATALLFLRPWFFTIVLSFWHTVAFIVALAASVAFETLRKAMRHRKDPFCIHCGYSVLGLASRGQCPECGRGYSVAVCREYQRDPHWFRERWLQSRRTPANTTLHVPPPRPGAAGQLASGDATG